MNILVLPRFRTVFLRLAVFMFLLGSSSVYGQTQSDTIPYRNTLTVVPSTLIMSGIRLEYQRDIISPHHKLGVASTFYYVNFPKEKLMKGYKSVALAGTWEYIKSPNRTFSPIFGCTVEMSLIDIMNVKPGFIEQEIGENTVLVERLVSDEITLIRGRAMLFVGGQLTTDRIILKPRISLGVQDKIGDVSVQVNDFYDFTQVYQRGVVVELSLNIGGIF